MAKVSIEKILSGRICNVNIRRHSVLLGMVNTSTNSEYLRKQGYEIYRITGKITKKHCRRPMQN